MNFTWYVREVNQIKIPRLNLIPKIYFSSKGDNSKVLNFIYSSAILLQYYFKSNNNWIITTNDTSFATSCSHL